MAAVLFKTLEGGSKMIMTPQRQKLLLQTAKENIKLQVAQEIERQAGL